MTPLPSARLASFFLTTRQPPRATLFPYTTLFRSGRHPSPSRGRVDASEASGRVGSALAASLSPHPASRSEEHTSELQSRVDVVCSLLLEKKKICSSAAATYCRSNRGARRPPRRSR